MLKLLKKVNSEVAISPPGDFSNLRWIVYVLLFFLVDFSVGLNLLLLYYLSGLLSKIQRSRSDKNPKARNKDKLEGMNTAAEYFYIQNIMYFFP